MTETPKFVSRQFSPRMLFVLSVFRFLLSNLLGRPSDKRTSLKPPPTLILVYDSDKRQKVPKLFGLRVSPHRPQRALLFSLCFRPWLPFPVPTEVARCACRDPTEVRGVVPYPPKREARTKRETSLVLRGPGGGRKGVYRKVRRRVCVPQGQKDRAQREEREHEQPHLFLVSDTFQKEPNSREAVYILVV